MRRAAAVLIGVLLLASRAAAQPTGINPATIAAPVVVFPSSAVDGGGTVRRSLLFSPDGTFDIGANGATRPAAIWVSGQINGGTLSILSGAAAKFAWSTGFQVLSGATPTISSGFGTSPAIAGAAGAFRVTLGNPVAQSGVVLFNNTPTNGSIPVVLCRDETTQTANPPTYTATTSQVTITFTTAVAGDSVACIVLGLP